MNKLQKIFYTMVFLALNFPARAFGAADLYGPSQVMYGTPTLYGMAPYYSVPWYVIAGRWFLLVVLPIIILIVIIMAIIRRSRKKK